MKSIIQFLLSALTIAAILIVLMISLKIKPALFIYQNYNIHQIASDLTSSFLRVTAIAVIAWILAALTGKLLHSYKLLKISLLPAINFIRHISPFAWLPFALIWFGLGEAPAAFIMFIALFFPAVILTSEIYSQLPIQYRDEADICGATEWQKFTLIEIPLLKSQLINLFRILWGLGWTTVIAVEMLGVDNGLGYRLLDLRYLLKYHDMVVYLIIMGSTGIAIDAILGGLVIGDW